jgi:glutamate--cysteine ligase
MSAGCDLLDKGAEIHSHCDAPQKQRAKIADPDLTPSARMLDDMAENKEEFYHFALRKSREHQQWFAERPLEADKLANFRETARSSIEKQHAIEAADDIPFETFMQNYFAQA